MKDFHKEIGRIAHTLSGKERACLLIKDWHETYFNDGGFLSASEKQELSRLQSYASSREYKRYARLYKDTAVLGAAASETYLKFYVFAEQLATAHLAFDLLSDDFLKSQPTLDALGQIQTLEIKKNNACIVIDNPIFDLKKIVGQAFHQACLFLSTQELIKKTTEELGFCPLISKDFDGTFQDKAHSIHQRIKEHNAMMTYIGKNFDFDVREYLMGTPAADNDFLLRWEKTILKNADFPSFAQ